VRRRAAWLAALALAAAGVLPEARARVIVHDRFGGQIAAQSCVEEADRYLLTIEDGSQVAIQKSDVVRVETVPEEGEAAVPGPEGEATPQEAPAQAEGVTPARGVDAGLLVEALDFPDKRVRVHAARTLLHIRPDVDFEAKTRAMEVLADAIGTTHVRVILVITSHRDYGNMLAQQIRDLGAVPDIAFGGVDGIRRAKRFPAKDLVLLDTAIAPGEDPQEAPTETFPVIRTVREGDREVLDERLKYSREVFLNLRKDFRTAQVPIVLVADADAEGRPARAWTEQLYRGETHAGILERDASGATLGEMLDRIFREDERLAHDAKAAGEEMARLACEAVASLDPDHAVYDLGLVRDPLIAAVDEPPGELVRSDVVRLPALHALGVVGDEAAYPALLRVFANRENTPEIRQASAQAAGRIIQRNARTPASVYRALRAGLAEDDPRIWASCATALGLGRLPPQDITPLLVQERIQGSLKR
jgi:HEAT repeat protein